jgi:hypothetical protein
MTYFVKYSNSKVGMQQQQLLEFAGRPGPVVGIPNPGNAGGQFGHVWGRGARLGGPVIPGAPLGAQAFYAPFNNANRANIRAAGGQDPAYLQHLRNIGLVHPEGQRLAAPQVGRRAANLAMVAGAGLGNPHILAAGLLGDAALGFYGQPNNQRGPAQLRIRNPAQRINRQGNGYFQNNANAELENANRNPERQRRIKINPKARERAFKYDEEAEEVGGAESEEVNTKNNGNGAQPRRVNKRDPRLYHNATRKISTNASNNNHRTTMVRPSKALRRAKKLHRELQLPEAAGAEAVAEPSEDDEAIAAEPAFLAPPPQGPGLQGTARSLLSPPPQVLQGTARSLLSPPPPQGPGLLARVLGGAAAAGASLFNPNAYLQNPGSSSSSSSYSQPAIGKSRKMYKKRNSITRKLK